MRFNPHLPFTPFLYMLLLPSLPSLHLTLFCFFPAVPFTSLNLSNPGPPWTLSPSPHLTCPIPALPETFLLPLPEPSLLHLTYPVQSWPSLNPLSFPSLNLSNTDPPWTLSPSPHLTWPIPALSDSSLFPLPETSLLSLPEPSPFTLPKPSLLPLPEPWSSFPP